MTDLRICGLMFCKYAKTLQIGTVLSNSLELIDFLFFREIYERLILISSRMSRISAKS